MTNPMNIKTNPMRALTNRKVMTPNRIMPMLEEREIRLGRTVAMAILLVLAPSPL
jgi:hypothetical protein